MSRPAFMLWPGDKVIDTQDMRPDFKRGLRAEVKTGTLGEVDYVVHLKDERIHELIEGSCVLYCVHWKPTSRQKLDGWRVLIGTHTPDDVGYLLRQTR